MRFICKSEIKSLTLQQIFEYGRYKSFETGVGGKEENQQMACG